MNREMRPPADFRSLIWRVFFHNGWLKLISLLFSGFFFLIVRTQQVREFSRTAKLHIVTADNVVVVGNKERVVDVTVKLPESLFSRQPSDEELSGEIDLRNERLGKIRLRLSRDNFPLLDKRYQLTVHDPWLEVDLDAVVRKRLPVKAVLLGLPRNGLEIVRVVVSPEEVEVEGARREVSRLESLNTSPIDIENIDKNFSSLTRIVLDDTTSMSVGDDKINVQVLVGPRKSSRVFRSVPVVLAGIGKGALKGEVRPAFVEVEIRGEETYLQSLDLDDVRAFIDAGEPTGDWQERKIRLKIPANTSLVRVAPDTISLLSTR
jgi:YbbR domain-containing protein